MCAWPIYFLLLCLTSLLPLGGEVNESAVEEVIGKREQLVENIAKAAEQLYLNRVEAIRSCVCSRHDCAYDLGDENARECTSELIFESCENDCGERLVNYNKTAIRTPFATNPQVLTSTLKESICTYSGLEGEFSKVKDEYGLTNSWTYIGLRDGHFRTWPLRARARAEGSNDPYLKDCKPYDPRRRPWYSAASTGPKDVMVLVDSSASTAAPAGTVGESSTVWAVLQGAVEHLLDTFIHADYVNVVHYSNVAQALWEDAPFAEGNPHNRNILKDRIRRLRPSGSTNIANGFEKAIDLFRQGAQEGTTTNCNRIIIVLTEGRDTRRQTSEILTRIEAAQVKLEKETGTRAIVFVYTFGVTSDVSTAQQIACANEGFWSLVLNFDNPLTDMIHYLETVATARGTQGPVWVDPYEDAGGLGILTTVSMPVFSRGKPDEAPLLLGVVGHDVRLDDLIVDGYDADAVLSNLIQRSKQCKRLTLGPCDLQVYRSIENPSMQCADKYPSSTCYHYGNRWYRRFEIRRSRSQAEDFCESMNGTLAPVRSQEHLRFLSAVASADKSWIDGQRVIGTSPIEYTFTDPSIPNIDQYHIGWATNHPDDLKKRCVTLDRRSTSRNLESHFCDETFNFICEFLQPHVCDDDILDVMNHTGGLKTFMFPNPKECPEMERAINDTLASPEARELLSEAVICPFGKPVFHEELYCCVTCLNTTYPGNTAQSSFSLFTLAVTLLLIPLYVLI